MTSAVANTLSLWQKVKADLKTMFPSDIYDTWFHSLDRSEETNDSVIIEVPNDFTAFWIEDNYYDLLQKQFEAVAGKSIMVELSVVDTIDENENLADNRVASTLPKNRSVGRKVGKGVELREEASKKLKINADYTFRNFVVGSDNQMAHAACMAIANSPASSYNPLFLYGDSGLGKTHLMQAVAHSAYERDPSLTISYLSCEKFTNEFILAIQEKSLVKFRKKYRNTDILLIDDIHFLAGKEGTQEEFFHTFNELHNEGKQIFLSSDRPPHEISKLSDRLISRFQWGLMIDVQPPDFETRVAILNSKAKALNIKLPADIINFLANSVTKNVRRLEGALIRLNGYTALSKRAIDVSVAERLLEDILQEESRNKISIERIQKKVCEHHHLGLADMKSRRRPRDIAFPRQIAMYLCRTLTGFSLQEIGDSFGGRDHGTVIHACKIVEDMMEQQDTVKRTVGYLSKQLSSSSSN